MRPFAPSKQYWSFRDLSGAIVRPSWRQSRLFGTTPSISTNMVRNASMGASWLQYVPKMASRSVEFTSLGQGTPHFKIRWHDQELMTKGLKCLRDGSRRPQFVNRVRVEVPTASQPAPTEHWNHFRLLLDLSQAVIIVVRSVILWSVSKPWGHFGMRLV